MLRFFNEFFYALRMYPRAFSFSRQHKLWGYYIVPALLNLLILGSVFWLGWHYSDLLIDTLNAQTDQDFLPDWLTKALEWLILFLVKILVIFLFLKLYTTLVLLLLSPVLGMVAEKVQTILRKESEPEFELSVLLKNIVRGIRLTLRNTFIELSLTIFLVFLGLILPFLSPFTTALILTTQAYFIGFGMIDLRNEYLGLSARESIQVVRKHRGLAIGNGLGLIACIFVPVMGALFGPVLAVIAANLAIFEKGEGLLSENA